MPKITESTRSFLLSFAVFVPLLLLAFFALRTLSLEQDALKARNVGLMETRLDAMASTLTARLELSGRDELQIARDVWSNRGPEALRYFVLSGDVGFALPRRTGPPPAAPGRHGDGRTTGRSPPPPPPRETRTATTRSRRSATADTQT